MSSSKGSNRCNIVSTLIPSNSCPQNERGKGYEDVPVNTQISAFDATQRNNTFFFAYSVFVAAAGGTFVCRVSKSFFPSFLISSLPSFLPSIFPSVLPSFRLTRHCLHSLLVTLLPFADFLPFIHLQSEVSLHDLKAFVKANGLGISPPTLRDMVGKAIAKRQNWQARGRDLPVRVRTSNNVDPFSERCLAFRVFSL